MGDSVLYLISYLFLFFICIKKKKKGKIKEVEYNNYFDIYFINFGKKG